MSNHQIKKTLRTAEFPILDHILHRWSPRSMSGAPIAEETALKLFEAAKWAPSSMNEQEWRFLYAHRDDENWTDFLELLVEGNRGWCSHAGLLIVVLSKKTFSKNGVPNLCHSLDTGMAVQNLLLEAASSPGLAAHPMGGFDRIKARRVLEVPEDFDIECMIAVGHQAPADQLSDELKAREFASNRRPISQTIQRGKFRF